MAGIRKAFQARLLDWLESLEASRRFLSHSPLVDLQERMSRLYKTRDPEILGMQKRYAQYLEKIQEERVFSLQAHPVRAYSKMWNIAGAKLYKEIPEIIKSKEIKKEELDSTLKKVWEENFLRIQSLWHYEKARGTLCQTIKEASKMPLTEEVRNCVFMFKAFDPRYRDREIPQGEEQKYLNSLYKTVRRWNDPGKQFRKIPRPVENLLIAAYKEVPEEQRVYLERLGRTGFGTRILELGRQLKAARKIYSEAEQKRETIPFIAQKEKKRFVRRSP